MRFGLQNGNGAMCDCCRDTLTPFDIYRLEGKKTIPGKRYPNVSSDLTSQTLVKYHLCFNCYNKIITFLNSL